MLRADKMCIPSLHGGHGEVGLVLRHAVQELEQAMVESNADAKN